MTPRRSAAPANACIRRLTLAAALAMLIAVEVAAVPFGAKPMPGRSDLPALSGEATLTQPLNDAFVLITKRKTDEAAARLRRIVADHPDELRAWYLLTTAHLVAGRPDKALAAAERCRTIAPDWQSGYWLVAQTHIARRDHQSAFNAYTASIRAMSDSPGGYLQRATFLVIHRAADKASQKLALADLDLLEINEAYAATPLVSTLELCANDEGNAESLRERCNVDSGAVAIGHPLGASGARISLHLALALAARGGGYGAAAICGGFGQGDAVLLEVPAQA